MTPKFEQLADKSWKAAVDGVDIFVDDSDGQPEPAQFAIAQRLAESLAAVRDEAARYLDLFVDRRKACGRDGEEWWLEEIEMRGMRNNRPRCGFFFTLDGDDGGQWTVDMAVWPDRFHPIRLERNQG